MRAEVVAHLAVLAACRCPRRRAARRSTTLLVSTIWPSSSSVPIARTSHSHRRSGWRLLLPPRREDVEAGHHRERRPRPTARMSWNVSPRRRSAGTARRRPRGTGRTPSTCPSWRAGSEMPRRAGERAVHRDRRPRAPTMIDRGPREVAVDAEREEPAEHEELVGQRVEERARAGRAVAAGEPAVEPVGAREHEPQVNVSHVGPWSSMRSSVGTARNSDAAAIGDRRSPGRGDRAPCAVRRRAVGLVARSRGAGSTRRAHGGFGDQVGADRLGDVRAHDARPGAPSRRRGARRRRSRAPRGACGRSGRRSRRRRPSTSTSTSRADQRVARRPG